MASNVVELVEAETSHHHQVELLYEILVVQSRGHMEINSLVRTRRFIDAVIDCVASSEKDEYLVDVTLKRCSLARVLLKLVDHPETSQRIASRIVRCSLYTAYLLECCVVYSLKKEPKEQNRKGCEKALRSFQSLLAHLLSCCARSAYIIELLWSSQLLVNILMFDVNIAPSGSLPTLFESASDDDIAITSEILTAVIQFIKRLVSLHEQKTSNNLLPRDATLSIFYELLYRFTIVLPSIQASAEEKAEETLPASPHHRILHSLVPSGMEALVAIRVLCLHDGQIEELIRFIPCMKNGDIHAAMRIAWAAVQSKEGPWYNYTSSVFINALHELAVIAGIENRSAFSNQQRGKFRVSNQNGQEKDQFHSTHFTEQQQRERACIMIQKVWRGIRERKRLLSLQKVVVVLQHSVRRWIQKRKSQKELKKKHQNAQLSNKYTGSSQYRDAWLAEHELFLHKLRYISANEADSLFRARETKAAICFQRVWRGRQGRIRVQEQQILRMKSNAATKIQRCFRQYRSRKHLRKRRKYRIAIGIETEDSQNKTSKSNILGQPDTLQTILAARQHIPLLRVPDQKREQLQQRIASFREVYSEKNQGQEISHEQLQQTYAKAQTEYLRHVLRRSSRELEYKELLTSLSRLHQQVSILQEESLHLPHAAHTGISTDLTIDALVDAEAREAHRTAMHTLQTPWWKQLADIIK